MTPPSAIAVSGLAMTAGTASCQIAVNGVTNSLGGNPDCTANPAAFTNGPSSMSGLANAINGVTNQCLVVATQNGVLLMNQSANVLPGATFVFPHSLINGPLADTYTLTVANLAGTFNFSSVQIFPDANGDGIADSAVPIAGTINLMPNQTFRFVAVVNIPATAAVGTFDEIRITAASTLPGRLAIPPVVDHIDVIGPPAPPNTDL
ncbi:MAG: hypothetical protein JNJ55_13785, partial [Betaproteobacteria bacterium]|nr:hypothetical protein [Betaproteobacteria bacterium]